MNLEHMDDKTLQALTALSTKLGTTVEYLWGVLLRQAPITGAIELVLMCVLVTTSLFLIQFVRRKTTKPAKTNENPYPKADWPDEGGVFAWMAAILFAFITALIVFFDLSNVVSALINPEYWALRQILK
jgi:hypothetical protein